MSARPILFSKPMVLALLAGTKTQTRRIVKPQPDWDFPEPCCSTTSEGWQGPIDRGAWAESADPDLDFRRCPYGGPGDLLIVRENFTKVPASAYRMSEGVQQTVNPADPHEAAIYAAGWDRSIPKWTPSIHMPRWASRLTLEITDVRVERLQNISEADAKSEGIGEPYFGDGDPPFEEPGVMVSRWMQYRNLWKTINGADSWADNPWVWVVSFKVHRRNIDQRAA